MALQSVSVADIHRGFKRVANLLVGDMKTLNNRTGWYQEVGNKDKVGDVATAQGILIFDYIGEQTRHLPILVTTLKESQFHNEDGPENGGWAFISCRDTPTVEATVWAILGLLASKAPIDGPEIVKGERWLQANQNPDGGWGAPKSLTSRVYITYLACLGLSKIGPAVDRGNVARFHEAHTWLLKAQNADGGWGEQLGRESSPIHTAFALLTLHILEVDNTTKQVREAIQYLYKIWHSEHMWEGTKTLEFYSIPQRDIAHHRVVVNYFPTPWVINALLSMGENVLREQIFFSIKWLIGAQNTDGSWTVKNVDGKRLWAIHDATLTISLFLKKIMATDTAERILLSNDFLIISHKERKHAFVRAAILFGILTLLCGFSLGVATSSLVLDFHLETWLTQYGAWLILALYILSIVPLVRNRIFTWKECLLGIIFPVALVVISFFLRV